MSRQYFTVGEVDRLVPRLERLFVQVFQLRAAMRLEEEKIERAGLKLSKELMERDNPRDPPAVRNAKLMFKAYYETLTEQLAEVDALGGEVKDLEEGLVDFPARRKDEEILLCWKFGERTVGYYHSAEAGFRGRRPIDDEVPREPQGLD